MGVINMNKNDKIWCKRQIEFFIDQCIHEMKDKFDTVDNASIYYLFQEVAEEKRLKEYNENG